MLHSVGVCDLCPWEAPWLLAAEEGERPSFRAWDHGPPREGEAWVGRAPPSACGQGLPAALGAMLAEAVQRAGRAIGSWVCVASLTLRPR